MGTRSAEAGRLAGLLSLKIGRRVECAWHGSRTDHWGGWHVSWCDGPTVEQMQELVTRAAPQVPKIAEAPLRYSRAQSDHGHAVAVLLWLDADRTRLAFTPSGIIALAHDEVGFPERTADVWHRRATALQLLGSQAVVTTATAEVLTRHASPGWDAALRWLDRVAENGRALQLVG